MTFTNVNMAHCGESYCGRRWIERELLVSRAGIERYEEEAQSRKTHSPIRLINIVTNGEWHAIEHGPQVNTEEDHIQRLLGNVQDENGESDHYNKKGIQWLSGANT
jgi:hypothetical protein